MSLFLSSITDPKQLYFRKPIKVQYKWLIFILAGFLLSQCIKEEASLQDLQLSGINPGLGLPTVHARYYLSSVFDTVETPDLLQPNEEGILAVKYSQKVFSGSASSFITFDQAIEGYTVFNKKKGSEKFTIKDTIEFSFSNYQAMAMDIKGLLYEVKFNYALFSLSDNSISPLTTVGIKFPSIIKPGTNETASLSHNIGEGSTSSLNISGFVAKFINNDNMTNGLPIEFTYDAPFSSKGFTLNYSFTLIDYEYIKGYFGNFDYKLDEINLTVDFLSEVDSIDIKFEKAEFSINYTNSFGIALAVYLDNLNVTSVNNDPIDVDFLPTADSPFNFSLPTLGDSVSNLVVYDLNDVLLLLKEKPKEISFEPVGEFNPEDKLNDTNFVTYDSRFSLDVALNIPLKFWASIIAYQDTFAFDGSSLEQITQLEYLGLLLTSSNLLPLDAKIKVSFLDGDDILYQVRNAESNEDGFQISSNLDADGIPIEGEPFEQLIDIDKSEFEKLKQTDNIALKIALKTVRADEAENGDTIFVAFMDGADYYIDIKLKLIAEGEFILPPE